MNLLKRNKEQEETPVSSDVEPVAPPPDLSSKPKDIIGYCFGFSCPDGHIGDTFGSITMDRYGEQRVCQTCGKLAMPAIVKRTAEALWLEDITGCKELLCIRAGIEYKPVWSWTNHYPGSMDKIWTKREFVRFLNDAKGEDKQ